MFMWDLSYFSGNHIGICPYTIGCLKSCFHGEEEAEVRLFKLSEKLATEFEKEKPTDGRFF